ncbi:MAG: xanthine dehydrogenase family protein molybdopterin-binding subunit [Acidimicrobiales bacterium]
MSGSLTPAVPGIGERRVRVDAAAKVTGAATYPADRFPPGALVAKVVFTNQPHARLASLDLEGARAVPGVVAIFGSEDVPVNEYGLTLFDQPVILGLRHTGRSAVACDVSRWEADCLAVVVAETTHAADTAAAAIIAHWEPLPILDGIEAATAGDAPLLHPENGLSSNVYEHYRIRKGDPDTAFAAAAVIIEGDYEFPYQEHAYLQPEAAVSYLDDQGRVTVEIAGQWAHEDQEQIAHALDLPLDQVRVIYPAIGGAFGGREDMSLQIVLALAAWRLAQQGERRPITCRWSREESIVGHHKRHRGRVHARLAATAEGRITAVEATAHLDSGGYNYTTNKVLGNLHLGLAGCYEVPNARIDSYAVYTNAAIGGAFRGFGGPQSTFVAETQMNKLAHTLGMDPIELRRRNVLREGSVGITQTVWPAGVSLPEVIEECDRRAGFRSPLAAAPPPLPFGSLPAQPEAIRRGRGMACAFKNIGYSFGFPERCEAEIRLYGVDDPLAGAGDPPLPDRVELYHAGAEVGQGSHQAFLQMAAGAVGVAVERVEGHFADTATSGDSGSVSASRMTWMAGNAILGAAEEADKRWRDGDRPAVGKFRFTPPPTEPLDPDTGACTPNFTYSYVAQHVELSVDVETGHVVIDRVVSVHDVGRAINPALVVGQIDGGVVQAHGYTLSEDLQVRDGRIMNPRLSTYLIPGIGDTPRSIEAVVLELADPLGPWGARGLAELPFMAYAPAVAAALHDATGVWFNQFPLTPSRVLAGLRQPARREP